MRKIKNSIFLLLLIILFCVVGCGNKPITITNSITGFVSYCDDSSITITLDNNSYVFNVPDDAKEEKVYVGDEVTIDFDGTVSSAIDVQDVVPSKVKVVKYADLSIDDSFLDDGIFSDYYQRAYRKLLEMSLEDKVGQILFARVPQTDKTLTITNYHLGGYIMFGRDFKGKTKDEIIREIESYQSASSIPLIIAVDEEGGDVVRVSSNPNLSPTRFKSPRDVYNNGGLEAIKSDVISKSNLLYSLGINMNLAPVADVSTDANDYIYDRTLGKSAQETAVYIKTVIETSKNGNVSYVLKHFPGYGNNKDTHTGIAIDNRSLDSFRSNDFLPFKAGIEAKVPAILVSHNIMMSVDDSTPASLSKEVHNILRDELAFTGIIITDDLDMEAIKDYATISPFVDAIRAGNDLLIVTDYDKAYNDILLSVNNKVLDEKLVDASVLKVLAYKYHMGYLK